MQMCCSKDIQCVKEESKIDVKKVDNLFTWSSFLQTLRISTRLSKHLLLNSNHLTARIQFIFNSNLKDKVKNVTTNDNLIKFQDLFIILYFITMI